MIFEQVLVADKPIRIARRVDEVATDKARKDFEVDRKRFGLAPSAREPSPSRYLTAEIISRSGKKKKRP